jgi:hypothetical protein
MHGVPLYKPLRANSERLSDCTCAAGESFAAKATQTKGERMSILPLNQGGTGSDLSGTGGPNEFVKQNAVGADLSVAGIATADIATGLRGAYNVGSVIFLDGVQYTSIANAIAALPASGGTILIPAGHSEMILNTVTVPPNTHIQFLGAGNTITISMTTGPVFRFNGGQSSIDGFSPVGTSSGSSGTTFLISSSSFTGDVFKLDWATKTNANIFGNVLRNFTIDMGGSAGEAIYAASQWFLTLEDINIIHCKGNGFHFADEDSSGTIYGLQARFLYGKNLYVAMTGGTGQGFIWDSLNGGGISECTFVNLHVDAGAASSALPVLFTCGPASGKAGQNAQMFFASLKLFTNTTNTYAVEFRAPSGSSLSGGTGGVNTALFFHDLNIENGTSSAPTVPAITSTVNGVRNGAATGWIVLSASGAAGYQSSAWTDGIDYANLGAKYSVLSPITNTTILAAEPAAAFGGLVKATGVNFGGTTLGTYTEDTWTPVATNLTTSGSVTLSGTYTKVGRILYFNILISVPSGASAAGTNGTTTISLPTTVARYSAAVSASSTNALPYGGGNCNPFINAVYPPTFSASSVSVSISGWYETS